MSDGDTIRAGLAVGLAVDAVLAALYGLPKLARAIWTRRRRQR